MRLCICLVSRQTSLSLRIAWKILDMYLSGGYGNTYIHNCECVHIRYSLDRYKHVSFLSVRMPCGSRFSCFTNNTRRDVADFRLCRRLEIRNICALLWSVPVTAIGIITPFRLIGLRTKKKQTVDHILNERRRKALASTRSQRRLFID